MAAFFTELFRVDPADVESLLAPELERNDDTSLWLRNLGDLELVELWESLPNSESDGTLMSDVAAAGESLVFTLPENFITSIRDLADADIQSIADNWALMDELVSWQVSDLVDVIRRIRGFIRDAGKDNQIVVQLAEM
ncbi:MAG: hypothetical protein COA78_18715 [Blastopirellula sp.]|nr:MAG: hypothetical protein COA78_18715 [Blastopirellula sp.]